MGCELISLRGVADAWEGGRSDTLDEERADTYGGYGRMFEWVRADAWVGCGRMLVRGGGQRPLGGGGRGLWEREYARLTLVRYICRERIDRQA